MSLRPVAGWARAAVAAFDLLAHTDRARVADAVESHGDSRCPPAIAGKAEINAIEDGFGDSFSLGNRRLDTQSLARFPTRASRSSLSAWRNVVSTRSWTGSSRMNRVARGGRKALGGPKQTCSNFGLPGVDGDASQAEQRTDHDRPEMQRLGPLQTLHVQGGRPAANPPFKYRIAAKPACMSRHPHSLPASRKRAIASA